jgi:hypothetical protein
MKGPYSIEPGNEWHIAKGACTFYGPPKECQGQLTLVNTSDSKVKVRNLMTQPTTRLRKDWYALKPTHITLAARLQPHSQSCVMSSLKVPIDTTPGNYQASILCGQQKTPIEVIVLENREIMIEPRHFSLRGTSGETVSFQLAITNLGNVPITLGDVGMVWFREQDWIGRTLVYALRETAPNESLEEFGNRLLHRFHDEIVPTAKVQFEPSKINALPAGKSTSRTLSLALPVGLKKGRRYLGFIKINEERIWLEVYCTPSTLAPEQK